MIPIAEIFGPTIQGEGPHSGHKCIFVRVVGCDFKCEWCDSKFAWKQDENTKHYTEINLAADLLNKCIATNTNLVILTGGNPCLYNFSDVIEILHHNGIKVDIETQGSVLPDWLDEADLIVFSPKAPSSKQPDVFANIYDWIITHKNKEIAIKIPVFDEADFEFALVYYGIIEGPDNIGNVKLYINVGNTNTNEVGDISARVLDDYHYLIEKVCNSRMKDVYIMPQLHTLVWGNKQGV